MAGTFLVRKLDASAVVIDDLGITISGTAGTTYDLIDIQPNNLSVSDNLVAAIGVTLEVLDPRDGTTALSTADGVLTIESCNSPHFGINGGRFAALDDPAVTPATSTYLKFDGTEYVASDASDLTDEIGNDVQDLIESTLIDGSDITFVVDAGTGNNDKTITINVDDSFLRNTGDNLTSGTLTIDSGAAITVSTGAALTIADAPVNPQDAANKAYVDSISAGLDPKESVRVASAADLAATYVPAGGTAGTGSFTSAPTLIDGVVLVNGDRVLVKDQFDAKQNGIYEVIASTIWNRAEDQDGDPATEVSSGNYTFVEQGTASGSTGWVVTGDGILTLNVDDIVWVQFSGTGAYTAGVGLGLSGSEFYLDINNLVSDTITSADSIAFNDIDAPNTTKKITLSSMLSDLDIVNSLSGNGIAVQTAADTYTARSIIPSTTAAQEGILVVNGDGVAGNMSVGLDINGLTDSAADLTATDELAVFDGTNNLSMSGQQLADGVGTLLGLGSLTLTTINGQTVLTIVDSTRGNKILSVDSVELTFSENRVNHLDWLDIGNAVDADSGFVAPMNGTIVMATGNCENTGANSKDFHVFVNTTDQGSLGTLSGGTNVVFTNTTANFDFTQGDRIRVQANDVSGRIQDTVVSVYIKWRG